MPVWLVFCCHLAEPSGNQAGCFLSPIKIVQYLYEPEHNLLIYTRGISFLSGYEKGYSFILF